MTKNMLRGLDPATIIAVFAFLGGLALVFDWRLETVRETQATLKIEVKDLKTEVKDLKNGQIRIENKINLLLKEKVTSLKKK